MGYPSGWSCWSYSVSLRCGGHADCCELILITRQPSSAPLQLGDLCRMLHAIFICERANLLYHVLPEHSVDKVF